MPPSFNSVSNIALLPRGVTASAREPAYKESLRRIQPKPAPIQPVCHQNVTFFSASWVGRAVPKPCVVAVVPPSITQLPAPVRTPRTIVQSADTSGRSPASIWSISVNENSGLDDNWVKRGQNVWRSLRPGVAWGPLHKYLSEPEYFSIIVGVSERSRYISFDCRICAGFRGRHGYFRKLRRAPMLQKT